MKSGPSSSDRKLELELRFAQGLAAYLNGSAGSDYTVSAGTHPAVDAVLKSASGQFPEKSLQVVSVPVDPTARMDNGNIRNFEIRLSSELHSRSITDAFVSLHVKSNIALRPVPVTVAATLAEIICKESERVFSRRSEEYPETWERVDDWVDAFSVYRSAGLTRTTVSAGFGTWVPSDSRWIIEGVEKKRNKYDNGTSRSLVLLVACSALIDQEQLEDFRKAYPIDSLAFLEVWFVGAAGVVRLK